MTTKATPAPLHVSFTTEPAIRYVFEGTYGDEVVDVPVTERDWDVKDPVLRAEKAEVELGEIDHYYQQHARWFINPEKNAAALCVFRPKVEKG